MQINQNSKDAVIAFAQKFAEYNIEFENQAKATTKSLEAAGKVWKDSKYAQFKISVDKHIEEINSIYALMEKYTDHYLPGVIDILKKYGEYNLSF